MHEHSTSISLPSTASDVKTVTQRIYQSANILQVIHHLCKAPTHNLFPDQVPSGDPGLLLFAGQTVSSSTLVLVSLALEPEPKLTVNTENIVLGGMVIKEIRAGLEKTV